MSRSRTTRSIHRKKRKKHRRRSRLAIFWPGARPRQRIYRALWSAPWSVQLILAAIVVLALWSATNWIYQVARKPAELFFPMSHALSKMPAATWRQYESIFRAHATATITPDLLAALAQIEGAGNPMARTYWRWRPSWSLFELYRPASSAVGIYQFTDATFAEARRYCIHDHVVAEDGPWHDLESCWFNSLYTRVVPTHAVELTSAYLDRRVSNTLERRVIDTATLQQKQDLAGVIHLCGAGAGESYAKRGFRLTPGQRCGDHDVRSYLAKLNAMKRVFARMATAGQTE